MRKAIQIAAVPATEAHHSGIYALCDDGNIFLLSTGSNEWSRLPDIPQEPKKKQGFASLTPEMRQKYTKMSHQSRRENLKKAIDGGSNV